MQDNKKSEFTTGNAAADKVMFAIASQLKAGKSPYLDDLKSSWGNKDTNRVIRELTKNGLAGVYRRRLRLIDNVQYRYENGVVEQRGPGRFLFKLSDGSEAYLTAKSSRLVLDGDEVRAFVASEPGSDSEAIPVAVTKRDLGREHVCRALQVDGQVVVFLDNRVEPVSVLVSHSSAQIVEGDVFYAKCAEVGVLRDVNAFGEPRRIGNSSDAGFESKLAFETRFSKDAVCKEEDWPIFQQRDAKDDAPRDDLAKIPFVTIDGESTSDFDDAVFARKVGEGWELIVAIADVSAFVTEGSDLDTFAKKKMTSVYLPHVVHPMLPRSISTGICSLNPNEDRFALCCKMKVSPQGVIESYSFNRAKINSHARLTYRSCQDFLDGRRDVAASDEVAASLVSLNDVSKALRAHGTSIGRLDMGDDEVGFKLGVDGKIESMISSPRLWSHKLVEECMLAANRSAAEFLHETFAAGVFRNHPGLREADLAGVHQTLDSLGLKVGDGIAQISQAQVAAVLEEAKSLGKYSQVRSAILGAMSSASYQEENKGHFSLVADFYCHFTSPIRRYADLLVHRMIKAGIDGFPAPYTDSELAARSTQASKFGQTASQAENEARKLLQLDFMNRYESKELVGNLSTIGERGVWLAIPIGEAKLEFFVSSRTMKDSGYVWSDSAQTWASNGENLREDDQLTCRVANVDFCARRVDLVPRSLPAMENKPSIKI